MAIKVIVELKTKHGRRDDLKRLLESLIAMQEQSQQGFLGSTRYEVLDDPDTLVEIADWESVEARETHMKEAAVTGAYAPLVELLAAPFRATVNKCASLTGPSRNETHRERGAARTYAHSAICLLRCSHLLCRIKVAS